MCIRDSSPEDWLRPLDVYGATEQEALSGKLSPGNRLAPLANARIPVLAVVGDADKVVPLEENMAVVERKYQMCIRDSRPAIQLYRKAGFREVEIYRPSYERVDIQMELALQ